MTKLGQCVQQKHVFGLRKEVELTGKKPRWAQGEHTHITTYPEPS